MISHLKKGFTLVELMIVIAIIGLLAAALYPSLTGYIERATFTGQLKGMVDMNTAIQAYFIDKSVYPSSIALGWNNPYGCYASPVGAYTENNWIPGLVEGGYISHLPIPHRGSKDCLTGDFFIYSTAPGYDGYKLLSHGHKTAKYVVGNRIDLLDPARDGGVDEYIVETGSTLDPWGWGYWTENMIPL